MNEKEEKRYSLLENIQSDLPWESDLIGGIFIPPGKSKTQMETPKQTEEYVTIDALSKKESDWHVSISPDGENVLVFNHKTFDFKVIDGRNQDLNKVYETSVRDAFETANSPTETFGSKVNDGIDGRNNDLNKVHPHNTREELFKTEKPSNDANLPTETFGSTKVTDGIDGRNHEAPPHNTSGVSRTEKSNFPKWMIAVSNRISQDEVIVAISQTKKSDMTSKPDTTSSCEEKKSTANNSSDKVKFKIKSELKSVRIHKGESEKSESCGKTVIYKVNLDRLTSKLSEWLSVGGIVAFIHTQTKDTYCLIFNVSGIRRKKFTYGSQNSVDIGNMELFDYPKRLQMELKTLCKKKSCLERLDSSIFGHHFFIEQYREGIQVLQLYNLTTMKMEQIFNIHEGKSSIERFGNPIFASSKNERIIAFSPGYKKISLFLKENGLEIASEDFKKNGKDDKILFCEFINDDETLIIITQESKSKTGKVLFWNLFNTKHKFKLGREINFEKSEKNISSVARIPGKKLITINTDGKISSLLDDLIKDSEIKAEGAELHSIVIHKEKDMSHQFVKKNHKIYECWQEKVTKRLLKNKEMWTTDDYNRTSVYLDKEESVQLFIGRSTVQVWRRVSEKKTVLEYIWANNVEVDREKKCELKILELYVGERCFYLKVRWDELKYGEFVEVKWPCNDNHVTPIKHACDALEHLNYRRNKLIGYKRQHKFENMKDRISYIIWRFIKHKPDVWRLMDVRFDIMAKIIIGGSNTLVKYILFGDGKEKNWNLHVPILNRWDKEYEYKFKKQDTTGKKKLEIKKLSDLQIAIRLCEEAGIECSRRTLIVAYLLEYYTENSLKHIGWLATVSEALPYLYNCGLENYAKELFYKRCISGLEISNVIEYTDFTPEEIQFTLKTSQNFQAFSPISKLISKNKLRDTISLRMARLYAKLFPNFRNPSPSVKAIPLYKFTVSNIPQNNQNMQTESQSPFLTKILNVFKFLFIPRGYLPLGKDESQLSPLVQIARLAKDDNVFDNPAMEAAIDYKWGPARNYFLRIFFMYMLYAVCFAALVGCYLGHIEATGPLHSLLLFLFILFYFLGLYLFVVEYKQFRHRNWRHYLEFFNFVDLASIVTSLAIMSVYVTPTFNFTNAFADVTTTTPNISAAISFTMLLVWFEFILYLRLLSEPAKYLYIILNIINRTYIFVAFMLLVVLALSHVFLLLLQHADFPNHEEIKSKTSSLTIFNGAGEEIGHADQVFDRVQDNPSKDFGNSFLSTYAWLRGSYPQDSTWDFWAVQALTLIGSLFLITIVQNIFIAFIWGVYTEAFEKGRVALLQFRAGLISDYEALDEIYFSSLPSEPTYLFYTGKSKSYDAWDEAVNKREKKKVKLYGDCEKIIGETKLTFKEKNDEQSFWNYNDDDKIRSESEDDKKKKEEEEMGEDKDVSESESESESEHEDEDEDDSKNEGEDEDEDDSKNKNKSEDENEGDSESESESESESKSESEER